MRTLPSGLQPCRLPKLGNGFPSRFRTLQHGKRRISRNADGHWAKGRLAEVGSTRTHPAALHAAARWDHGRSRSLLVPERRMGRGDCAARASPVGTRCRRCGPAQDRALGKAARLGPRCVADRTPRSPESAAFGPRVAESWAETLPPWQRGSSCGPSLRNSSPVVPSSR